MLEITLKKSVIGRIPGHRATVRALGLRRINQCVVKTDSPMIRGMIKKVSYLVTVKECS